MYCKSCGTPFVSNESIVCLKCGGKKGEGKNFCQNCGNPAIIGASVCLNCGASLAASVSSEAKSKMAAGLLGIFLGSYGVHNFYLGYTEKAIAQLCLTLGGWILGSLIGVFTFGLGFILYFAPMGAGIWGIIEGVMILSGSINTDANGNLLKE